MKPGDLAVITIPIPSLFESIGCEPNKVLQRGEIVVLLRYEPTKWYWPCWQVLYDGQLGVIAARWLKPASEFDRPEYLSEDT